MKSSLSLNCLLSVLLVGATAALPGETVELKAKPGSTVRIEGTSTMHDWTIEGSLIGGSVKVPEDFPLEPGQLPMKPGKVQAAVNAVIPITSLKSVKDGKPYSTKMDEIAHEKLGKPAHNRISYELTELEFKEAAEDAGAPYIFEAVGNLVVGGVTNTITLPVEVTPLGEDKVKFATKTPLKMSDYNIKGPELTVLGVGIKTGDDVSITIEWMTVRVR